MKTKVLILCTGNSCRSQMAEGFLKKYANDIFDVYSAGIETHGLNPKAVERQKKIDETNGDPIWEMRIGINTGELISGVIGTSKFAYDVWGDTVNIASRMESIGSPGSITISETTQELIKDYIETEPLEKMWVKGLGETTVHKVLKIRPKYASDLKGTINNEQMNTDFYRYVLGLKNKELHD